MTPTNATLKITVNKKINGFQAMQSIKSENEVFAVQDYKKEKKKQKKAKIFVPGCEELSREKRFYKDFDDNFVHVENKKLPKKYH